MASSKDFVDYVTEQLSGAGFIQNKRMFGEHGIYLDDKFIGAICDNQLFLKITPEALSLYPDLAQGEPYKGAKPYFMIENLDNTARLEEITLTVWRTLPEPKPKKKKS